MRRKPAETAFEIANDLVGRMAQSQVDDDFEAFLAVVALPFSSVSDGNQSPMHTREDVLKKFIDVRDHLKVLGVVAMPREINFALFDGPDIIHATHETTLMAVDGPAAPSYQTYVRIKRTDQGWRVVHAQYWMQHLPETSEAILGDNRHKAEQSAIACDAVRAVFQRCLNSFTITLMKGKLDQVWHLVQPPLFLQGSEGNRVLETREDVAAEVESFRNVFRENQVTDIVRLVKSAEMIGERRITGAFRTHVLSGTHFVMPSYLSNMTMEQGPDLNWRVTSFVHPMQAQTLDKMASLRA